MEDKSRRTFLKVAGASVLGGTVGVTVLARGGGKSDPNQKHWAMVIDAARCISGQSRGCDEACKGACHKAHNVPDVSEPRFRLKKADIPKREVKWIWLQDYHGAFPDQQHGYTRAGLEHKRLPITCNHCKKPPCVRVCPTGATFKRSSDGIVVMDMHRCIGCRYCMVGCPYGSRSFNWFSPWPRDPRTDRFSDRYKAPPSLDYPTRMKGVVEKCNFCAEVLVQAKAEGKKDYTPRCVGACPVNAMAFGNLGDENSMVRKLLAARHTITRKPALGTEPQIYYIV